MQRLGALPRGSSFGRLPSLAHVGAPNDESRPARVRLAEPCLVIDDNLPVTPPPQEEEVAASLRLAIGMARRQRAMATGRRASGARRPSISAAEAPAPDEAAAESHPSASKWRGAYDRVRRSSNVQAMARWPSAVPEEEEPEVKHAAPPPPLGEYLGVRRCYNSSDRLLPELPQQGKLRLSYHHMSVGSLDEAEREATPDASSGLRFYGADDVSREDTRSAHYDGPSTKRRHRRLGPMTSSISLPVLSPRTAAARPSEDVMDHHEAARHRRKMDEGERRRKKASLIGRKTTHMSMASAQRTLTETSRAGGERDGRVLAAATAWDESMRQRTSVAERLLLALELERAEGEDLRRAVESIHRLRYVRGSDLVADAASLVPLRVR